LQISKTLCRIKYAALENSEDQAITQVPVKISANPSWLLETVLLVVASVRLGVSRLLPHFAMLALAIGTPHGNQPLWLALDTSFLLIAPPLAPSFDELELGSSGSSLYAKVYVKKPTRASVDFRHALGDFSERPSKPSLQQAAAAAHNINI
jgi:hypothetical protein